MEFLVRIEIGLPPDTPPQRAAELAAAEARRARELREQGLLVRAWRVPGRRANLGLWEAADATVLHAAIASLPLFPWMDVEVLPLALHPAEAGGAR